MNRLFCFGIGYSALHVIAELMLRDDWSFAGTCRTEEKCARTRAAGVDAVPFERGTPLANAAEVLRDVTHLLLSVPPDEHGDPVLDAHAADLALLAPRLQWAGYLSTTGVYGDRGGGWVDETSDLTPAAPRGWRRVRAEAGWFTLHQESGLPLHIFRLAGIYGPGRSPLEQLKQGTAHRIDKPGQYFSRIHVEDLAQVVLASMRTPNPGRVYNVCDDEPAHPADVVAYAAQLLQMPSPPLVPFADAHLSDMARSFYDENKRVRNDRMKAELGVVLRYPTYREGLAALASGD